MGKLSSADVEHVSKLARIKLSSDETEKFREQLSEIISYIDEISEVDVRGVEVLAQTSGVENVSRRDEIQAELVLSQERALSGTEEIYNGYFKVDAVIDKQ